MSSPDSFDCLQGILVTPARAFGRPPRQLVLATRRWCRLWFRFVLPAVTFGEAGIMKSVCSYAKGSCLRIYLDRVRGKPRKASRAQFELARQAHPGLTDTELEIALIKARIAQMAPHGKWLGIFRVFYNYCLAGQDVKTPAMRLGLAKGKVALEDIIYFKA